MSDLEAIIILVLLGMIGLGIIITVHARSSRKKLHYRLKMWFGQIPERVYGIEEFQSISRYYRNQEPQGFTIDDITWSDLELDLLFARLNNTQSSAGQEYLYYLLRTPEFSETKLKRRRELMDYLTANEEERIRLQQALVQIGRTRSFSISDYLNLLQDFNMHGSWKHYLCFGAIIAAIISFFASFSMGIGAVLVVSVINMAVYMMEKGKMDPYIQSMQYILRLLKGADLLARENISALQPELDCIRKRKRNFRSFRFGSAFVMPTNRTGGMEEVMLDYIRMILHIDLIRFYQMMKYITHNIPEVDALIAEVGFLDAMIAAASFRETLPYQCVPDLVADDKVILQLTDVYHPLLSEPIANSVEEKHNILLTGSNASGKSTFLKTIAINAIFAQTLSISFAKEYHANYYRVYTSMALKDNIMNSESYYIVEIKSLKRILDAAKEQYPMLCFVDEVLRGTNTVERIAASVEILKSISREGVLCFAATHDIELTHLLEDCFENYHFREQITGNDIQFDYQLHSGRATSRNAIRLLGLIGYDEDIIRRAEERTYALEKV